MKAFLLITVFWQLVRFMVLLADLVWLEFPYVLRLTRGYVGLRVVIHIALTLWALHLLVGMGLVHGI
jgi:hypothetical protein